MAKTPTSLPPGLAPGRPDDIDALRAAHAAVVAERDQLSARNDSLTTRNTKLETTNAKLETANARLEAIIAEIRRAHFGRKSERISEDQLKLALDELETAAAKVETEAEKAEPTLKTARAKKPRTSRDAAIEHLPHEDVVIEPESTACPCCGKALHKIGEDTSKRLDKIPAKIKVIVTRRPKYACRNCEKTGADDIAGIIQAPAPARLIEGGLPTEAFIADIVVSKYADHLPLYRQSQILTRLGVSIERSTLAQWVGAAAAELQPLHDHLLKLLLASPKLFCGPGPDPGDALSGARSRAR